MGIGTFDLHAILCNSVKQSADNERFAEWLNSVLQIHRPFSKDEAIWIVLEQEEIKPVHSARRAFRKQFVIHTPKQKTKILPADILTTT